MKVIADDELRELTYGGLLKVAGIKRIYKYISFDDGIKYLVNDRSLKFTSPDNFNDPFDCNPVLFDLEIPQDDLKDFVYGQPYTRKVKRKLLRGVNKMGTLNAFKRKRKETRVCCFSESNNNNLMWSHYANYHKGLCIGFEFPIKYKNDFVLYAVNYLNTLEKVKFTEDTLRVIYYWITTKSPDWSYEKEIRAINIHHKDKCEFDQENLKEIIVGYNTSKKQIEDLVKALKKNRYPKDIELNQVDIDKKSLKLIIKKIGT